MELNQEQKSAVESEAKLRLVIASPGSGKTRVLVSAVEREAKRMGADKCCVVTFTRKAAQEMEDRLAKVGVAGLGWVGTLHGLMLKLCREHNDLIGFPESIGVLDPEQREQIVESIMADMKVRGSVGRILPLLDCEKCIGFGKSAMWTKDELVAKEYHSRLRNAGLLDFSSMMFHGRSVIMALDGSGAWPFQFLAVDEVQDSSQDDFGHYFGMPCERKLLVGDPDQSVFGFRGGWMEGIIQMAESAQWEVHKLQTNYRSGVHICEAANRLISHNLNRVDKLTVADKPGGSVMVHECDGPAAEHAWVVNRIVQYTTPPEPVCHCGDYCKDHHTGSGHSPVPMQEEGEPYKLDQIAILCRTNTSARDFLTALKAAGIPVKERRMAEAPADWRKAKLLLTALGSPWSDFAVKAYLVAVVGQVKADLLEADSKRGMTSLNEAAGNLLGSGERFTELDLVRHGLSAESRERIAAAVKTMRGAWDNAELLLALNNGEQSGVVVGKGVTVCTVHAMKGLEADVVFMPGMEEGNFPQGRKDTDTEEERRLAFVGVTRAREQVLLSWCSARPQYRGPNIPAGPAEPKVRSRFVGELFKDSNTKP